MNVTINDLPVMIPFRVYDVEKGHCIFSIMSPDDAGDIPPDVATLPVVGIRSAGDVLYIDVRT